MLDKIKTFWRKYILRRYVDLTRIKLSWSFFFKMETELIEKEEEVEEDKEEPEVKASTEMIKQADNFSMMFTILILIILATCIGIVILLFKMGII